MYVPVRRPAARRMASAITAVLPFPFDPAICTVARPRCGLPSSASSARIGARSGRSAKSPVRSKSGSVSSQRRLSS